MTVRAAEKAAQDGGARQRPRRATPVDPALAERARSAAERLTGLRARLNAGKLEIHFGDETRLEELVEALEALVSATVDPSDTLRALRAISSVG